MDQSEALADRLERLERQREAITDVPEQPRSVMNVIEYGLGEQRRAEVYVNRLLRYFLDSSEPHGMGSDFLRAFLEGLPPACNFQEDLYELSDVIVDEQVSVTSTADANSTSDTQGWLDLLIEVPTEWFLLIELKFSAAETGTSFYCDADTIGGQPKDAYESGEYYLYLHQDEKPEASGACFKNWTWREFVQDVLNPFVQQHSPRYPQRTVNQLRELEYDLKEIIGMSNYEHSEREKADLYIEHYDAVSDVTAAFENQWETFQNEWDQRLSDRIDDEEIRNDWQFYEYNTDWAFLFKTDWWRRTDTFEPVAEPTDPRRVRVGFLHRLEHHRDIAVGDHELKFQFRNTPPNRYLKNGETNFRDAFIENFNARRQEIASLLPERATLTGNMHNQIEATYEIPVADSPDFFSAYITALHTAFADHVIENPDLVTEIDEVYHETLEEFN